DRAAVFANDVGLATGRRRQRPEAVGTLRGEAGGAFLGGTYLFGKSGSPVAVYLARLDSLDPDDPIRRRLSLQLEVGPADLSLRREDQLQLLRATQAEKTTLLRLTDLFDLMNRHVQQQLPACFLLRRDQAKELLGGDFLVLLEQQPLVGQIERAVRPFFAVALPLGLGSHQRRLRIHQADVGRTLELLQDPVEALDRLLQEGERLFDAPKETAHAVARRIDLVLQGRQRAVGSSQRGNVARRKLVHIGCRLRQGLAHPAALLVQGRLHRVAATFPLAHDVGNVVVDEAGVDIATAAQRFQLAGQLVHARVVAAYLLVEIAELCLGLQLGEAAAQMLDLHPQVVYVRAGARAHGARYRRTARAAKRAATHSPARGAHGRLRLGLLRSAP